MRYLPYHMTWLQLFQCQGIWRQNIESICTATYCVELPGIQYHSRHSFHWKVLLPSAEHKTHSITAGILNSLLFFYIIRNRQDPGKTNFPAAVTALLISGVGSSHQRNKLFSFAEPKFSLVYVYCQTNYFTWRWRGYVPFLLVTIPASLRRMGHMKMILFKGWG